MPDIYPRRWLPAGLPPANRVDFCVFVSALVLLGGGVAVNLLTEGRGWGGPGAWLSGWTGVEWRHLCPFCGGTRSFLAGCRGDLAAAASYSLMGLAVFLWLVVSLPLRGLLLWTRRRGGGWSAALARWADAADGLGGWTLLLLMGLWALQLLLHGLGWLEWAPWAAWSWDGSWWPVPF